MNSLLRKSEKATSRIDLLYVVGLVIVLTVLLIVMILRSINDDIKVYASENEKYSSDTQSALNDDKDSQTNVNVYDQIYTEYFNEELVTPFNSSALRVNKNRLENINSAPRIVTIKTKDSEQKLLTYGKTVGEILSDTDINTEGTRIIPPTDEILKYPHEIEIRQYQEILETTTRPVQYESLMIDINEVDGVPHSKQYGTNGEATIITKKIYEDGVLTGTEEVSNIVTTEPIPEITYICEKRTMWATCYDKSSVRPGARTYTGHELAKGVVAVDPNSIPLYTNLYIPGYGYAQALDIGGGIKGEKIDLGYDYGCTSQWRTGYTEVYVLCD